MEIYTRCPLFWMACVYIYLAIPMVAVVSLHIGIVSIKSKITNNSIKTY